MLSNEQESAVETTEGPLLIIAGPGSGKTFTLVERILFLIKNKNVQPENIMIATFTEKAASELITRISNKLHEEDIRFNLNEMYIGTLHSICLRILEENREFTRLKKNYNMLDQFDQQYLIYQKMRRFLEIEDISELLNISQSRWKQSEFLLKWINKLSEEVVDIDEMLLHENNQIKVLGKCYQVYQEILHEENALDFSTIQLETLNLLTKYKEIKEKYNDIIHYLMIDEFQDSATRC